MEVGLGYVRLGQPATTLSGGEAQRVKLASELQKRSTGRTVYVLDEPTTGLHFEDIRKLLGVLSSLVDKGNTVLVIEHNLDVIKTADWIVDMGPRAATGAARSSRPAPPRRSPVTRRASPASSCSRCSLPVAGPSHVARPSRRGAEVVRPTDSRRPSRPSASLGGTTDKTAMLEGSVTDNRISKTAGDASRRAVIGGIVGLGVGVPLLAACGSDDSESSGSGAAAVRRPPAPIGKTSEVPVGGGKIFKAEKVMVSQPSEGDFKAFSTVCTHQGCPITKMDGDEIECSCHGSRFLVADGSVANGPATKPLEELKVTVKGDELSVT